MNRTPVLSVVAGVQTPVALANCERIVILSAPGPLTFTWSDGQKSSYHSPGTTYKPPRRYGRSLNSGQLLVECDIAGNFILGLLEADEEYIFSPTASTPPVNNPYSDAQAALAVNTNVRTLIIPTLGFKTTVIKSIITLGNPNLTGAFVYIRGCLGANFVAPVITDHNGVVLDDGKNINNFSTLTDGALGNIIQQNGHSTFNMIDSTPFDTLLLGLINASPGDACALTIKQV